MIEGFMIAVLDKGFVYVGDVMPIDGGYCITGTRNIRVWGTTSGLGELALGGPTSSTVLDDVGTLYVPTHACITLISTDKGKW